MIYILSLFAIVVIVGCGNNSMHKFESEVPASSVPQDKPLIFPFDSGIKIWDISSIPDREETRIEFPHLAFYKGYLYCSFREGEIHGNHISGRGRVIRSNDGINWETAGLFDSETGDIRDPRLSVTTDGKLMLNGSIAFIEDVAPYQVIDGQPVRRQSVTWLSSDGTTWSGPFSCPSVINTWLWDVAWHKGFGYSIGYSGKDPDGSLYRTKDGKTWENLKENMFPGGHGNEAALTFGLDGTLYVLLRAGLAAKVSLGVSHPPYEKDWNWYELDAYWDGKKHRQPVKDVTGGADLGGPNLITLEDGRLFGAGRVRGNERANYFLIDPGEKILTRMAGVQNGSSYPGIVQFNGDIWLSYIEGGAGPVYIKRIKL